MDYKNILKLRWPLLMLFSLFANGQNRDVEKRQLIVKSFFQDVFLNNRPLTKISEEYRCQNKKDKLGKKFVLNVMSLQMDKKHLYQQVGKIKIEHYPKSSIKDKWLFEKKERKNIYVVSIDDKVESYVLMKRSKIVSFLYFRKGRDNFAYFIPYWMLPKD